MRSKRRDYQVYAVGEDGWPRRLVASAATFEAALAERDRDVLAQLRAGGGRTLTVTHELGTGAGRFADRASGDQQPRRGGWGQAS